MPTVLSLVTTAFFISRGEEWGAPFEFSRSNEQRLRATRTFLKLLPPNLARKIAFENAARIYKLGSP
jgi:hypothetical protein